jgi:aminobenzoyl-glutamate utilization protein B
MSFFLSGNLVQEAWNSFQSEIAGTTYKPLLPADLAPPAELNQALMDRYRPAMEKHYTNIVPVFS